MVEASEGLALPSSISDRTEDNGGFSEHLRLLGAETSAIVWD